MFQEAKFISDIFDVCIKATNDQGKFNAQQIIDAAFPQKPDGAEGYWMQKNSTDALGVLESAKLISGSIQPEYTKNLRLTKEVRYGQITTFGKLFNNFPLFLKRYYLFMYLTRKGLISFLAVLAFIKLSFNAMQGAALLAGWIEYIAALLLIYIAYVLIRKIID
jgi:hypothetical protein